MGILGLVAAATLVALSASLDMEKTTTATAFARSQAERIVQQIARDVRYSGTSCDGWAFPAETANTSISFSRCTGWDALTQQREWGSIITYQWEIDSDAGELDDEIDNNGNAVVDEGNLYRQQGGGVRVLLGKNIEKSSLLFWRVESGNRDIVTIRVAVVRSDPAHPSSTIRGVYETEVSLRN